jgi:DNA-binding LacI/PurR family transcriptional regulator/GAF domain-containing protein
MGQERRLTIGLLDWGIGDAIGHAVWAGVAEEAQAQNVNAICFMGGMAVPGEFGAGANVVYSLVGTENIDGLVVWSPLFQDLAPESMRSIYDRYRSLPIVNIGSLLEGIPSVLNGNYQGMYDEISHLVQVHGYRRIAYIRGPDHDPEAEARYRAYEDVLAEHSLVLDEALVMQGTNSGATGVEAVRGLLDDRGLRPGVGFEAIAASCDTIAFGALEELQSRSIWVPGDVALVGFDDAATAQSLVSMTTVRYPFHELARQAVRTLLAMLSGERVPEQVTVPAELVVRHSCGCLSPSVVRAEAESVAPAQQGAETLLVRRDEIVSEMTEVIGHVLSGVSASWGERLLDGFDAEVGGEAQGVFLSTLEQILYEALPTGKAPSTWQEAISALRRGVLPGLHGKALARAENLWQQARVMIGETAQRMLTYQMSQTTARRGVVNAAGQAINAAADMAELLDVISRRLRDLRVKDCYLALFEDLGAPTEWSRLVLAYDEDGRVELEQGGRRFRSRRLVPEGMLRHDKCYKMLIQPLYFQQERQGFIVLSVDEPGDILTGGAYDTVRNQISSALHRVLLVGQEARARAEAEESRQQLEAALMDLQAAQRRYVREAWEAYDASVGAGKGYVVSKEGYAARADAWLALMADAVQQQQPVSAAGEAGAELALPIVLGSQVIGVLGFGRDTNGDWGEDEIADAQAVIAQMAQALENQRLLDEELLARIALDEQVKALDCLNDIGRRMEQVPPIPEFLQWVAERVPRAMRHSDVCLAAVEFGGEVYGSPEAAEEPRQIVQGMRIAGDLVGRVCIAYTEDHEFLDEESALLGDIARRVGGYIENRQLLYESQSRAERERLVRTITDNIRRGTDSEAIVRTGLEQLRQWLGADRAVVRLGTRGQLGSVHSDRAKDRSDRAVD